MRKLYGKLQSHFLHFISARDANKMQICFGITNVQQLEKVNNLNDDVQGKGFVRKTLSRHKRIRNRFVADEGSCQNILSVMCLTEKSSVERMGKEQKRNQSDVMWWWKFLKTSTTSSHKKMCGLRDPRHILSNCGDSRLSAMEKEEKVNIW